MRTFVLLLMLCALDSAWALPRFASRTGARCQSCHVNPAGGGMRQVFGVQYGRDQLPVPTWSEELGLDDFSTKLTEFVSVGADFRTLFFCQQATKNDGFFQMQGDIYLNFRLAKKVSIYLDKGLYTGFEIFGLLNILPENGYIKVGRFLPNYGTRIDDHKTYIRDYTGFSPEGRGQGPSASQPQLIPGAEHTGGEVAISPGPVTITGGVYNSADAYGTATDKNKAFLGRVEGMFKATDDINIGLGGNVFTRKNNVVRSILYGGFGSFSYQNFTLFGEVDLLQQKHAASTDSTGVITLVEADYMVTPGLDLKVMYEFLDLNKDFKTGSMSRYSFGLEFFPISGVEVRPLYRISKEEPVDFENNEYNLVVHFYL